MMGLSLGSFVLYGFVALGVRMAKPAFPFLIIPLVSWIVVAWVAIPWFSGERNREDA